MKLIYGYDFETTGFPLWSKPSSDPGQPHIVQCAAVMVDADTRQVVHSFDLIAKPGNWEIPEEASNVHGITTERALQVGIPENHITWTLWEFHRAASLRVGHNQPFDARIMRIALNRLEGLDDAMYETMAESWKEADTYCTQSKSTPILKLPPTEKMLAAGRKGNKTANLREAYQHFTGRPLENAHSAMADAVATMAVYWGIMDMEPPEPAPVDDKPAPMPVRGGDGVDFL